MKFIPQAQLDKTAWDEFVAKNNSAVFSCSWYLDSCAKDWCVLVDDQWENGIALSIATNLGIENTTPFIFGRTFDFIGNDTDFQVKALAAIQKRFKLGILQTEKSLQPLLENLPGKDDDRNIQHLEKVHQVIESEMKLGSQAKRMLKKAEKSGLRIEKTTDWKEIISIAEAELSSKISEFNALNLQRLRNLAQTLYESEKLICMGIFEGEKLVGGMLFITASTQNLYLKGAAFSEAKKNGGMYLCMHTFIQETLAQNKTFDFGGSSVPGVQRFNYNFGGTDRSYHVYQWDNAPWWYSISKKLHHAIKKKRP